MLGSAWAAPIALTPIPRTTLAVVHRSSHAPAARRPARAAKPQDRILEHDASFQTRGPDRPQRRREQERRISRSNKKGPGLPGWARLNAPFPALGAGWGAGLRASGGPRARGGSRWREARFQRAVSPVGAAGRRSRARPAVPSEAAHATLIVLPDARVDRLRQSYRDVFVCVVTDDFERSDRGVQIVPPLLLQFAVRVKRLRIRIQSARRLRKIALLNGDRRHAAMARFDRERGPRRATPTITIASTRMRDNIDLLPDS